MFDLEMNGQEYLENISPAPVTAPMKIGGIHSDRVYIHRSRLTAIAGKYDDLKQKIPF